MASWVKQGWQEFEEEVTSLVSAFGYTAITTQGSHDYGVDVIANSDRRRVLVQCKLFKSGRVGGPAVMQLVGTRTHFGATDAICITTGTFSRQARDIALQNSVILVDRETLIELCVTKHLTIPSLTFLAGDYGTFALRENAILVGRLPQCEIELPSSAVSRQHAVFIRSGLALTVSDRGSSNGTWVNGTQIKAPTALSYGDSVRFGDCCFQVALVVD